MEKFFVAIENNTVLALQQEIALYREYGVDGIAEDKALKTKNPLMEEVARLRAEEGYVLKVTEDDLKTPIFADANVKAGEVVLFSQEEVDTAREAHDAKVAEDHKAEVISRLEEAGVTVTGDESIEDLELSLVKESDKANIASKAGEGSTKDTSEQDNKEESGVERPEAPEEELVYLNKTVVSVTNRVLNGKVYKDVHVASGETFTLTSEEFEKDVKPRNEK